mgnify:CR=1
MTRKITIGILIAITIALIGWDVWVYLEPTRDDTISEVFLWFSAHPVLPFAFGVLSGHLMWSQNARTHLRS